MYSLLQKLQDSTDTFFSGKSEKRVNWARKQTPWVILTFGIAFTILSASLARIALSQWLWPALILLGGALVSTILALLVYLALNLHKEALHVATIMTRELNDKTEYLEDVIRETQENETQQREIIESIPGFVSWFDQDLHYLGVNHELAQLYKMRPEEFQNRKIGDIIKMSNNGQESPLVQSIRKFLRSSEISTIGYYNAWVGRKERYLMVSMNKFAKGEKVIVISVDITEQKNLEKDLVFERAQNEQSSRLAALGEMAGGIAHEINNPLAIIAGKAEGLQKRIQQPNFDPTTALADLTKIITATDRISKIIKGLRSLSRDAIDDPMEPADVVTMINDTLDFCKTRIANHGAEIRFTPPTETILVPCRPVQISQIILNLLHNADDAISTLEERWIRIDVTVDQQQAHISVTDSGLGIPEQVSAKMMNPFFTTKGVNHGTGLGLSISNRIAQSHSGQIRLNKECKNTQFILSLPLVESTAMAPAA